MAIIISLICFNDISNAINMHRNDQISFNLINLLLPIPPIAAHAKMPIIIVDCKLHMTLTECIITIYFCKP